MLRACNGQFFDPPPLLPPISLSPIPALTPSAESVFEGSFSSFRASDSKLPPFWTLQTSQSAARDKPFDLLWLEDGSMTTSTPTPCRSAQSKVKTTSTSSNIATLCTNNPSSFSASGVTLSPQDTHSTIYYTPPTPAESVGAQSPALACPIAGSLGGAKEQVGRYFCCMSGYK